MDSFALSTVTVSLLTSVFLSSFSLRLSQRHSLPSHFRFPVVFFTAFVATSQSPFSLPFSCRLLHCVCRNVTVSLLTSVFLSSFSLRLSQRHSLPSHFRFPVVFFTVCRNVSLPFHFPFPIVISPVFVTASVSYLLFLLSFHCSLQRHSLASHFPFAVVFFIGFVTCPPLTPLCLSLPASLCRSVRPSLSLSVSALVIYLSLLL